MADTEDDPADVEKIRSLARRIALAEAEVKTAQDEVNTAAAAASDPANSAARQKLTEAKATLVASQAVRSWYVEQLNLMLHPEPKEGGPTCVSAVDKMKPVLWCIVGSLLALAILFFLLAIFDSSLWPNESGTAIARVRNITWISVTSLIVGLILLVVTVVIERVTQGRSTIATGTRVFTAVPVGKIGEAAQQVETAREKVTNAQAEVDRAGAVVKSVTDVSAKADAKRVLGNAVVALAAAQRELKFAEEQFALLTQSAAQAGGANGSSLNYLVFGVLSAVVLVFLMYGIVSHNLLPSLASISVSRGLITFLITVVTVTIALILVLATVVSESSDLGRRFSQGKEVLSMLIGVLGTIVGFYFGNPTDGTKPLSIAPPSLLNESPFGGETINFMTVISGGRAPYSYQVSFDPKKVIPDKQGPSANGHIRLNGLKVQGVTTDTIVKFQISAHDMDGKTATYDGSLKVKANKPAEPVKGTSTDKSPKAVEPVPAEPPANGGAPPPAPAAPPSARANPAAAVRSSLAAKRPGHGIQIAEFVRPPAGDGSNRRLTLV